MTYEEIMYVIVNGVRLSDGMYAVKIKDIYLIGEFDELMIRVKNFIKE